MRLSLFLILGLIGGGLSLADYDSIISAAKAGTLFRKINRDLANKVFPNGQTLLHVASYFGDKSLLIKIRSFMRRFDPNVLDGNGMSPLCLAANREKEDVEVVQFLISAGANVNQVCAEQDAVSPDDEDLVTVGKFTPFLLAVNSTFINTAAELKNKNANIQAKDGLDYSALCYAAMSDHPQSPTMLLKLLDWGADVNQPCGKIEDEDFQMEKKETPLFLAVRISNNEELSLKKAQVLIQKGADQKMSDWLGWLPIHGAAANGFQKVADFLLSSVNRAIQEELLASKTFVDEEDENESGMTPVDIAYDFQHTMLKYHLAFYLRGGEFGRETQEFYEMYATGMSKSASKIQEYVDKVASLDMSYFEDKETKASLKKFNLTENFGKLEDHLATSKETGKYWTEKIVDSMKGSFFELRNFGKIFLQSYDDVMRAVKPKDIKETLEKYAKKLKRRGYPSSMRRRMMRDKEDELNEESKDYSRALKEIKIFLKHINDHAKKNQEKASQVVIKLAKFRELLVVDRGNFHDDIEFLNCNVSAMNFQQLNDTGFELLKLESEIGMKDKDLENLMIDIDSKYKTLKKISDGRIAILSISTINQGLQGIMWGARTGIKKWQSNILKKAGADKSVTKFLSKDKSKWIGKIGMFNAKKMGRLANVAKGMKIAGRVMSVVGFGMGIVDLIFTASTANKMAQAKRELEQSYKQFGEKMQEIAELNEKVMRANRTMRNFEISIASREKATSKLEELVGILDGAIKEAELLKDDWGNIANNLQSLFEEASVTNEYLEEEAFISVESKLKVMRDQWSDISNSAQSIALTITTVRPECVKCRRKRSLEKPHSIGELSFDSEAGRKMIYMTEEVHNDTRHALYDFMDNTFPVAARSVRHIKRFLVELQGNIDQLQKVHDRYEERISDQQEEATLLLKENTSESQKKAKSLKEKNKKFMIRRKSLINNLLTEDIENDLNESLVVAKSTYNTLQQSTIKAHKLLEKLSNTNVKLNDLKAFTQDEIVDLYIKAVRKRDKVQNLFQSINDKTDEVIRLQNALTALAATSLTTAAIPKVGWLISLAIAPAQIALEAAKSKLQKEITKESEEYIELQKQLLEKRVELGRIDLDLETVMSLKELVRENTEVLEEMNSLGEDQHGWSSIAVGLSTMIDLGLLTKQEVATDQFRYLPVDMQVMRDGTASIIRDMSNMRIRFES